MPPLYSSLQSDNSVCKMALLPVNTKFVGPAVPGDGSSDVVDDAINFFRVNSFFKQYDVNNTTDRVIIYLTLYITECLKKAVKCGTKNDVAKELTSLAITKFDIPGDASFPLNAYYSKPSNAGEADRCRAYILQLRQECSARMSERLIDVETGKPSKWWLSFSKRKFLDKSLAPMGQ